MALGLYVEEISLLIDLSHNVASGSDITPCLKIHKPRFTFSGAGSDKNRALPDTSIKLRRTTYWYDLLAK